MKYDTSKRMRGTLLGNLGVTASISILESKASLCQQVYYIKIYVLNYVVNANAILEWYIVVKRLDVTCTRSSKEISRTKGNKEKKVALYGHLIDRSALENNSFFSSS